MVGLGVGASGTSLLVLLAASVAPRYRGAAATTVWVMMILGFIVTAIVAGRPARPVLVGAPGRRHRDRLARGLRGQLPGGLGRRAAGARNGRRRTGRCEPARDAGCRDGGCRSVDRLRGERRPEGGTGCRRGAGHGPAEEPAADFRTALQGVWAEPEARRFSVFVFVSMLAYSAQDLILEPFAGAVFGMTPGQSTQLSGTQHGGVLAGMIARRAGHRRAARAPSRLAALLDRWPAAPARRWRCSRWPLGGWSVAGLIAEPAAFPLTGAVFALGLANGAFARRRHRLDDGPRRARRDAAARGCAWGLWGAAQAIAFGLGGLCATSAVDLGRLVVDEPARAYGVVFVLQALLFVLAAALARGVYRPAEPERAAPSPAGRLVLETQR